MDLFKPNRNFNTRSNQMFALKFSTVKDLKIKINMLPYIELVSSEPVVFSSINISQEAVIVNCPSALFVNVENVPSYLASKPICGTNYYFSASEGKYSDLPKFTYTNTLPIIYEATLDPWYYRSVGNLPLTNGYNNEKWGIYDKIRKAEDEVLNEDNEVRESSGIEELY